MVESMNFSNGSIWSILGATSHPLSIAMLASTLCAIGLSFSTEEVDVDHKSKGDGENSKSRVAIALTEHRIRIIYSAISACTVTILLFVWTNSFYITMPFTIFSIFITWIYLRNKSTRKDAEMLKVWPEVTDHLISGIHSGLSLSEALVGLSVRGPEVIRPHFQEFRTELSKSGDFVAAISNLKCRFNSHGSDQILEAILLAKSLGGSELLQIFRTLGDFLRQDLALRKEIEIKHGWIRNSAHLSAAAPWLLLLLLSSQPGTAEAFSKPGGVLILLIGLMLTGLAYLWMERLGDLPAQPRVFK
ncbi:MAG: hypothetical protein HY050_02695 [Actinobacteria bacterium]|nr:hypothetical protein [Actinomycetota bacterium]